MRALKIAGAAVAAIVVVAGLVLVIGIPSDFLTSAIQTRVERETGYRLTIAGATRIGVWPSLNLSLADVTLQDPRNRDSSDRLTIGTLQADVTLSSLWSGHPEVTELVIERPVLSVPLLRERVAAPNPAPKGVVSSSETGNGSVAIHRVTVIDGAVALSNLRDRVDNRIDGINATAVISADRTVSVSGNARAGARPLKFAIKAAMPAPPIERQNIPLELSLNAPGLLQNPLTAKAEIRLNGAVVMINGLSGALGDGAFNGWASVDLSSKPLVKLDLDFQRLDIATAPAATASTASAPWSNASIDLGGLNYVDLQAKISAAEINFGQAHVAPAAIDATLANGVLKGRFANLGAYDGQANGDLTIDAAAGVPAFAMQADLVGVRALPLLRSAADFDKIDGRLQAKLSVRSSGASQRAIMSNLDGRLQAKLDLRSNGNSPRAVMSNLQGKASAVFRDGALRGLNIAQMIRSLTSGTLSGWQQADQQSTDLTQLSASFAVANGQATTSDLNLVGPLVRVTGGGAIDLVAKSLALRVEPKLVLTTEGQGRTSDPVGLGIPVIIDGPWAEPRIYPDVGGILQHPEATYEKLKQLGQGLFGSAPGDSGSGDSGDGSADQPGSRFGQTLHDLVQQGLRQSRNPPPPGDPPPPQQDSQPLNDALRQLLGR
jgi:AsmA protein